MLFVLAPRRLALHARCPGLRGQQNGESLLGLRHRSLKAILCQRGEFYETILDTIDSPASLSFHSDRLRVLE